LARAQKRHSWASLSASAGVSVARIFLRSNAGSDAIDSASEAFDGVIGGVLIALLDLRFEFALQPGARHHQIGDAAEQAVDALVIIDFTRLRGHAFARLFRRKGLIWRVFVTQLEAPLRGKVTVVEPGGYTNFKALVGNFHVQPVISKSGPIKDLDGNVIQTAAGNPGFPNTFNPTATQSLGYAAQMLEAGVDVVYAYIADVHDNRSGSGTFGPGEAGYVAQTKQYDVAFGKFFARLAAAGITKENTLFIVAPDENDHFAGGTPTPANCDGINTPCTYPAPQKGEININLNRLMRPSATTPRRSRSTTTMHRPSTSPVQQRTRSALRRPIRSPGRLRAISMRWSRPILAPGIRTSCPRSWLIRPK